MYCILLCYPYGLNVRTTIRIVLLITGIQELQLSDHSIITNGMAFNLKKILIVLKLNTVFLNNKKE
jgi:hypothetical protein